MPDESYTESIDSILVVIEGPGDNTRRPRPPNIPREYPRVTPPPEGPVEPKGSQVNPPSGSKEPPPPEGPVEPEEEPGD